MKAYAIASLLHWLLAEKVWAEIDACPTGNPRGTAWCDRCSGLLGLLRCGVDYQLLG